VRTIIMTKGIPASGKSTWAKEEMRAHPNRYKRINKDILRAMLDGEGWSQASERFMLDIRDYAVQRSLLRGFDVIVDDTNFSDKHWESMCRIAKRVGEVMVVEKYFDVDLQEALRRNEARAEKVPPHVVIQMFEKHVKGSHLTCRSEYFQKAPYAPPQDVPNLRKAIMVDIDGTLALSETRNVYDGSRLYEDTPFAHVVTLVKLLMGSGHELILMSGREDKWRDETLRWLKDKVGVEPYALTNPDGYAFYMRKTGDGRPDTVVKKELYEAHVKGKYDVRYVIDDRPCVCAMWRDLGLVVLQLDDRPF
jgi:predicted kinase